MQKCNGTYYLLVILDGQKIVGTGALVVERKFIHGLGLVGHIEDIAVARDQQGKKLGLRIIQALDFVAERVGCYKVSAFLTIATNDIPADTTAAPSAGTASSLCLNLLLTVRSAIPDHLGLLRSK